MAHKLPYKQIAGLLSVLLKKISATSLLGYKYYNLNQLITKLNFYTYQIKKVSYRTAVLDCLKHTGESILCNEVVHSLAEMSMNENEKIEYAAETQQDKVLKEATKKISSKRLA